MLKVLIIEDNATYRQCLCELLWEQEPDMLIVPLADGTELLGKIDTLQPDVVFMDVKLPGTNGIDLTRKIRAARCDLPVVVMTSHHDQEYRDAACSAGAAQFFQKDELDGNKIAAILKSLIVSTPKWGHPHLP